MASRGVGPCDVSAFNVKVKRFKKKRRHTAGEAVTLIFRTTAAVKVRTEAAYCRVHSRFVTIDGIEWRMAYSSHRGAPMYWACELRPRLILLLLHQTNSVGAVVRTLPSAGRRLKAWESCAKFVGSTADDQGDDRDAVEGEEMVADDTKKGSIATSLVNQAKLEGAEVHRRVEGVRDGSSRTREQLRNLTSKHDRSPKNSSGRTA